MAFIDKYHEFLKKYKVVVLVIWVIIFAFGIWLGPKFLNETSTNFEAPANSPSVIAEKVFATEFPGYENETSMIMLIRMVNDSESVVNNDTESFCSQVIDSISNSSFDHIVLSVLSYYSLVDAGFSQVADGFVSTEERSMLLTIDLIYNEENSSISAFVEYLREEVHKINTSEDFNVYLTGYLVMYLDMQDATEEDLLRMDLIVIPIALLVLAFVLRSLKLMILPIASMGISILASFLIMYPLALIWDIFSFVPSIMMSLVIALSIDYSLFLLSRYREEIMKNKSVSESVLLMSKHAGHTITVSGLTLAVTFLGLVFFPLQLLSTIGLGAAITIVITLGVNLSFTPAALLTFEEFFKKFTLYKKLAKKQPETEDQIKKNEIAAQMKSIWYKIGKLSTKYAPFVIIIVIIVAIPVSIQVFKFDRSMDFLQILPRGSDSDLAYQALSEDFSPGQILAFYVIIKTNQTNGIMNPTFFQDAKEIAIKLATETIVNNDSFTSIVSAGGNYIPFLAAMAFLTPATLEYNSSDGMVYRIIFNRYTNLENSTILMEIQTPFDPWADEAEAWIKETRVILEDSQAEYGYEMHLAEGSTVMVDAIDQVYKLFPIMIIVTILVVYILIALMFKSVFIPLRLIITIGLTLSWIYGLGIFVFKTQVFKSVIPALQGVNSFYWLVPIMAFSILIGIGLDYDIFLLSRISEFRDMGFTEKASIHKGLFKTGNIISFAGIIMAIAFSGLLFSRVMVLNQFGFMLCIAVLIDTFIIRTILVPAIMSLASKWNWWPKKVPEPTKTDLDIE
ncbi:MAG: MMPL family transporter [Candidatus Heimdallarchaeota archaeon]|nr:MMPL family transporter [Candidatus Heimdallarchaeota archaeon]MCK5143775.1 MMPL family transporter [Candidatus Heimdallarchaeota archaeon]